MVDRMGDHLMRYYIYTPDLERPIINVYDTVEKALEVREEFLKAHIEAYVREYGAERWNH